MAQELTNERKTEAPPGSAVPKPGRLKPKGPPRGGSRKGTSHKMNRIVKELVVDAMHASGSDGKGREGAVGYLKWLSRKRPDAFAQLVGKVIPQQVIVDLPAPEDEHEYRYSAQEIREALMERGFRPPTLIDSDPTDPSSTIDADYTEVVREDTTAADDGEIEDEAMGGKG